MFKYKKLCKKYQELLWDIQRTINDDKSDKEKVIIINNRIAVFEIKRIFNKLED